MASSPKSSNVVSSPQRASSSSTRNLPEDDPSSYPSLTNPRTQDVFQSIVKGRKSWKTLRGGEVVWPPDLEAALLEGLEKYIPDDSRETRLLGRFPMRNRFISDYIHEKTGKRRTAKQVGSRLQQLRDTCGGKRLLNLLQPIRRRSRDPSSSPSFQPRERQLPYGLPSLHYESESSSDSSVSSPTTPTEPHAALELQNLLYRGVEPRSEEIPRTIVYIDLIPSQSSPNGGGASDDDLLSLGSKSWSLTSAAIAEEQEWIDSGRKVERASPQPRRLHDIDPTITLLSPNSTNAQSHFSVHSGDRVLFKETTPLQLVDPLISSTVDGCLLYQTPLVPGFWDTIVRSSDASQYVILQRVTAASSSSEPEVPIFSAMYKFNYVVVGSAPGRAGTHIPSHQPSQGAYGSLPLSSSYHPLAATSAPMIHQQKDEYAFDNYNISAIGPDYGEMLPMDYSKDTMEPSLLNTTFSLPANNWSPASSNGSVYPSPVDNRASVFAMNGSLAVDDHRLIAPASSFSLIEPVPNFVSTAASMVKHKF